MGVFCRRNFECILSNLPICIFFQIPIKFVLMLMVQVSNRPETIPLTNDDQVSRSHITAIGHNELTSHSCNPSISVIVIPLLSQVICDIYCSRNPRPQTLQNKTWQVLGVCMGLVITWWRHQMETFCEWNPPVTDVFPSQKAVTPSFDFSSICAQNKRLSKQPTQCGFETPSRSLWRHCIEKKIPAPGGCQNMLLNSGGPSDR